MRLERGFAEDGSSYVGVRCFTGIVNRGYGKVSVDEVAN